MNLACYVTLSRIFLIIPIIYFITSGNQNLALVLFLIAGFTDYLDGFIARRTKTESSLGALLDLLADKLLVCLVLLWCAVLSDSLLIISATFIIICRELIISSLRQFLVEKIGQNPIKVSYVAKSKTTVQFISISFLIFTQEKGDFLMNITIFLLWMAALISVYSLINYFQTYKEYI